MTDEERLAGICVWRTSILCGDHSKCGSCGWNPKVEERRKEQFRKSGKVIKKHESKHKPRAHKAYSDSYCANYIEANDRAFGGKKTAREVRATLGIAGDRYKRLKQEVMEVRYGLK